jgi:fumarate reductase flavoprotein subunit
MKKKWISGIAVAALFIVAALLGAMPAFSSAKAYTGTAQGNGGTVTVTLMIADGTITNVKAEGPDETPGIGSKALEQLPGEMLASNSIEVDSISGATITSNAIMEAAAAALEQAGLTTADLTEKDVKKEAAEDIEEDTDLVVVGAGGAGMSAAITASDEGKKVIIVESQSMSGGNTNRAEGGMNAADTRYQDQNEFREEKGVEKTLKTASEATAEEYTEKGVENIRKLAAVVQSQYDAYKADPEGYFDTPELMALDIIIGGHGLNDYDLVMNLTKNSAAGIDWINARAAEADSSLKGLTKVTQAGGASVKRIHRPTNEDGDTVAVGSYIVPILQKNVESRGIEVLTDTTAKKILMDENGNAAGIEAEGKEGNKVTIHAKAVVIATGGFGANSEMVEKYRPELKGFVTTNAPGALGQGIEMGTEAGAATVDMEQIQIHPTVHVDEAGTPSLITENVRGDGAILVNTEGKRFFDETSTRDKVSAAELEQGDYVWLILDQKMIDGSALYQGYVDKGFTFQGNTPEELAEEIDVPAENLKETLSEWAEIYQSQNDAEFGRTSFSSEYALDTAPYYAIKVAPGIHHTMGGLKINTAAEVISTQGNAIPGLFAAGEVTGGVHGGNRLGGTAVTDIIVYGQTAGKSAVSYMDK